MQETGRQDGISSLLQTLWEGHISMTTVSVGPLSHFSLALVTLCLSLVPSISGVITISCYC